MKNIAVMSREELEQEVLRLRDSKFSPEQTAFISVTVVGQDVACCVYGMGAAYDEAVKILERANAGNSNEVEGGNGPHPDNTSA